LWVQAHRGFKSLRHRHVMPPDIADTRTHGIVGSGVLHFGVRGW
jgi:hypothetical protein